MNAGHWHAALKRVLAVLVAPLFTYLLVALLGSHLPRNAAWQAPASGITIHIATNGHHTGLILPAADAGVDWALLVRPEDLPDPGRYGRYLLFGWGDRDFYLNTPTWADLRPVTALSAIIGSGGSLVHVDHLDRPEEAVTVRAITLRPAEYRRLVRFITARFEPGGRAIPGYGAADVFYPARGRYSLFYTCNSWTADALAEAGVRVALWSPFSGGVMRWF